MKKVTKIDSLTEEQKKMLPVWRDKWIEIGLRTGETDWKTFEEFMPICYAKAGIPFPQNVVRVSSPLVGGLASAISEKLWSKYRGDRRGAVGNAVRGAVGDAVGDAVGNAVGNAVRGAVGGAVGNAVRGAVGGAVRGAKLNWHSWLGGQFWVGYYWYGSPSVVSFFTEVCGLKLSKDIIERATAYRRVCESVNYIWANSDFIIVCARPKRITKDENGRLHSEIDKAIEYPDGWGLYMLHGIGFDESLWTKITRRTITSKEALSINSADQRAIALQYIGGEKLMADFGGKIIGKDEYGELIELTELKDGNGQSYKYLKAFDPDKGDYVWLRTRPEFTMPVEAEAWSYDVGRWSMKYRPVSRT